MFDSFNALSCQFAKLTTIAAVATIGFATPSLAVGEAANGWSEWARTDAPRRPCLSGIDGFRTSKPWGGWHSFHCSDATYPNDTQVKVDASTGKWFSTVSPNGFACPAGQVIINISCDGDYCARIKGLCATPYPEYKTHGPPGWYRPDVQSEEPPNNSHMFAGQQVLAGFRCSGSYCDNLEFFVRQIGPEPAATAPDVTALRVMGRWEKVDECDGSQCGSPSISMELTTGVTKGKEVSKSSTVGRALSVMTGTEVKGSTGALPGGEVTAKLEVTGTWTNDQTKAVADSFSSSESLSKTVYCNGKAVLWQWVSTLHVYRGAGEEVIIAGSTMKRCAKIGEGPSAPDEISWSPS